MFRKKSEKEIDKKELNEVISLGKKILSVIYILIFIVSIYVITIIFKEWKIWGFLLTILKVLFPLFIGLGIAWLFDPFVKWMEKKGIRRSLGTFITYLLVIGGISIIVGSIVPLLTEQINEFAKSIPGVIDSLKGWVSTILSSFEDVKGFDVNSLEKDIFKTISDFGINLTKDLPVLTVNIITSMISGLGVILIGMVIGFYLLISFDNVNNSFTSLIPKRFYKTAKGLMTATNYSLRKWVRGAVLDCTAIFIVTSLALWLVGLKAPMLFGLFCAITNIIPYAGPYIGGAPAVIVGFSQGVPIGILTLLSIVLIQFIEGNLLQPVIMSKTTKLHPVVIMLGLLIFGHFFGIIGMVISTPIISVCKVIFEFLNDKYNIVNISENEDED